MQWTYTHAHKTKSMCGLLMNYSREFLMQSVSLATLAIFLGSFRMPYEEIRRMILEVDEDQLTEPMIQVTSPLITIHDLSSMPMFREDSHKCVQFRAHILAAHVYIYVIGCLYNWNLVIMNSFTNTAHAHQSKLSAVIMKEMVYARIIRLRHYTLLFFVVWDFHQARHWNTVQRHSIIFCLTLYIVYGNMPAEDNEEIISLPLPSAFLTTT